MYQSVNSTLEVLQVELKKAIQVHPYKTLLTVRTVFTYYRREIQVIPPDMKLSIKLSLEQKFLITHLKVISEKNTKSMKSQD